MILKDLTAKNVKLRKSSLCFLIKDDMVLLAMKKRGFGVGRWNGVGGKQNINEAIEKTAIRETSEEIGVEITSLEKVGMLDFYFAPNKNLNQQVIVFLAKEWNGQPGETEEMAPEWFNKDNLPFEKMWEDDIYWLPDVLKGKKIKGEFLFGEKDTLLDYKVKVLKSRQ